MASETTKPAGSEPLGRVRRVRKNLRQGMALAWAASPRALVRYSLLGVLSSIMPPIAVYLGARLVNRIAEINGLVSKVETYEGYLDTTLKALHENLDRARNAMGAVNVIGALE